MYLANKVCYPQLGDWIVNRVLQRKVIKHLSKLILSGSVGVKSQIKIDSDDGCLVIIQEYVSLNLCKTKLF